MKIRALLAVGLGALAFVGSAQADVRISLVDHAGVPTHALIRGEHVLAYQANHDLRRYWHTPRVRFVARGGWPITIDRPSETLAESIGFGEHDFGPGGPYATVVNFKGWTDTASHELAEMLVDPRADDSRPEVADECEEQQNVHTPTIGGVPVAFFATPAGNCVY
jgi:hypothetical protein